MLGHVKIWLAYDLFHGSVSNHLKITSFRDRRQGAGWGRGLGGGGGECHLTPSMLSPRCRCGKGSAPLPPLTPQPTPTDNYALWFVGFVTH
jgi:hypothetical protein